MTPTVRLFDLQPGELNFTASVLACEQAGNGYDIVLDRTAFFAEGGGQPADTGVLGGVRVLDVHERAGVIRHRTDGPLEVGAQVEGRVDPAVRLDHSQQHTGEHILSGLTCSTHHCSNVGFHIGTELVTLDFSVPLTAEEVLSLERRANEVVWRNVPVRCWFPEPEELAALDYRSKKELTGPVRIVQIEGADTCACCGTHVPATGAVGQIKVVGMMNYKGGVRLSILCGGRALAYANALLEEDQGARRLLSAKPGELAAAVERLLAERDGLKAQRDTLSGRLFQQAAEVVKGEAVRVLVADMLSPAVLRKAAGQLAEDARAALVLLPEAEGWQFAASSRTEDMRPLARGLCEAFGGKGGGPKDMVQGRLTRGTPEEIAAAARGLLG